MVEFTFSIMCVSGLKLDIVEHNIKCTGNAVNHLLQSLFIIFYVTTIFCNTFANHVIQMLESKLLNKYWYFILQNHL